MEYVKSNHKQTKIEENNIANDIVSYMDLKVKHFYDRDAWSPSLGGFTVVYHQAKRNSFVTLSTAVCSSKERYCRKIGKSLAVDNFVAGKTITLPVPKWTSAPRVIEAFFDIGIY